MKILCPSLVAGLQKKDENTEYRLMHYVLRQEVEEGVLLYNTLTCAMVIVTHEEAQNLSAVEGLIENRFLVPVGYDDKKFCKIVKYGAKLMQRRPKGIRKFTIVTTTGCNARCAYCFEKGTKPVNMTMETAEKVAQYIITHRGEHEEVQIDWFGGEPLYNFKVMDRICSRLIEHGVKFFSHITTNGYLFSEKTVEKAVQLWHLKIAHITLDGTEHNYNRIKGYIHRNDQSPFQRVLTNIGLLLNAGIKVKVRLHVSKDNVEDIEELMNVLADRYNGQDLLSLQILHLFELFGPEARQLSSEERSELLHQIRRLKNYGYQLGLWNTKKLNHKLALCRCMVDSEDALMIVPDGHLGLCEHHLEDRFFGHIDNDEWDMEVIKQSREYCEETEACDTCALYPICNRLKICGVQDICFKEERENCIISIQQRMLKKYQELRKYDESE